MLPPALLNFANRLSGYSTNVVRLECQGAKTVGPNNQVRFTLPANALLNMKSFAVHGAAEATATNTRVARLPPDLVSMFDRVEVSIGGVQLSAGCSHQNVLLAAQRALMGSDKGGNMGFTHGEMCRNVSYRTGEVVGLVETHPFAVQGFGGLLDSEVVLDSSLVGDIVITLHTAPASIISVSNDSNSISNFTSHNASGVGTYTLNNLFGTIEVMAISDPTYETLAKQLIAQKGYIEINFKNVHSSVQTHNGASRFNVSTQSLDRIWCTFRDATAIGPNLPPKQKTGYGFESQHPRIGGSDMFLPAAFRFRRLQGNNVTMQFSLNGALYPQFPARVEDWMFLSNQSLPQGKIIERDLTSSSYSLDCHVLCARLNLPGSEQARTVSGLDTRGISLVGQLMSTNDNAGQPSQCLIFSECTSSLRVGPGRTIEVIM